MKIYKSCTHCSAVLRLDSTACGIVTCPKCSTKQHTRDMREMPAVEYVCPRCQTKLKSYVRSKDVRIRCPKCQHEDTALAFSAAMAQQMMAHADRYNVHDGRTHVNIHGQQSQQQGVGANDSITKTVMFGGSAINVYARPLSLRLHSEMKTPQWYGEKIMPRFKVGRQVVGRIGKGVELECPTRDLYFSRTHFAIQVDYIKDHGSYRHVLCHNGHQNTIYLKQSNLSWVEVRAGDMPIINIGDLIRVGHTVLEVFYDNRIDKKL